jgi:hypothetical protein
VEQGGQQGQALVQAFREADTVTRCGRGGCHQINDQVTITITEGGQAGQYDGRRGNTFKFGSGLFTYSNDKQKLVSAGVVAHEIVHLTQNTKGTGPFNLHAEIDAHSIQAQLYEKWGLTQADGGPVTVAETIGGFKDKSDEEIMNAPWAVNEYRAFPLNEGGWRVYDDWKYTRWKYRWNRFYKPKRDKIKAWLDQ